MALPVSARDVAFVLRCSGAATLAFALASALGLDHPIWASISAVIVSQEKLDQTESAVLWRFAGTVVGIAGALVAASLIAPLGAGLALQTGLSVGLCAALVRCWPDLKVAMWTAPILFVARDPDVSLLHAGLWRGCEVVVGGLIGLAVHWLAELLIALAERAAGDSPTNAADAP